MLFKHVLAHYDQVAHLKFKGGLFEIIIAIIKTVFININLQSEGCISIMGSGSKDVVALLENTSRVPFWNSSMVTLQRSLVVFFESKFRNNDHL